MKIFKDAEGREWTLDINLDARNQVKERANIDFLDVEAAQKLAVIGDMNDAATVGKVLWVLCQEQADTRKIDERGFYRAIKGDVWDTACSALKSELADFFPKDRRTLLASAMEKAQQLQAMMIERAMSKLTNGEIEAELEKQMQRILNAASSNLPASLESIPDPSPQEN